jgi:hypothetical protein
VVVPVLFGEDRFPAGVGARRVMAAVHRTGGVMDMVTYTMLQARSNVICAGERSS